MIEFLTANLATIVISIVLIAVVALIIRGMIRDKKAGKLCSGCSGGCGCCGGSGCHSAHTTANHKKL